MEISKIKELINHPSLPAPIKKVIWDRRLGRPVINNKVVIPVNNVSSHIKRDRDISIVDDNGVEIAVLVLTKSFESKQISQLTTPQFIAFLNETSSFFPESDSHYKFQSDYVVLKRENNNIYLRNYYKTAPVWGGFSHPYNRINIADNVQVEVNEIKAIRNLSLKGNYFIESSIRALKQPYGFERFLKLYHLLELNFDYYLIEKIKKLDVKINADRIGKLLNEYGDNEIIRLTNIIEDNCSGGISEIVTKLNEIKNFQDIAFEIFNRYSKRQILIEDETNFKAFLASGDFSEQNLRYHKISIQPNYNRFILKLTAHWIYRVRCSIAHSTIGEFILRNEDEVFIVKFCEPLLKEIIIQCFKK
jgi:hypothetical protein